MPFAAIYLRDGTTLRRVAGAAGGRRSRLPDTVELADPGPVASDWGLAAAAEGRATGGDRRSPTE
ncbi:hypothetical protein [Micromonospora tarensis]|uniref:hypothetical protein n=1 Tax=Micromonospora tarensis TaxID=2806100 RepID=UPI001EE3F047|nr:hypothetical protein [Micromonospora tarensis]